MDLQVLKSFVKEAARFLPPSSKKKSWREIYRRAHQDAEDQVAKKNPGLFKKDEMAFYDKRDKLIDRLEKQYQAEDHARVQAERGQQQEEFDRTWAPIKGGLAGSMLGGALGTGAAIAKGDPAALGRLGGAGALIGGLGGALAGASARGKKSAPRS